MPSQTPGQKETVERVMHEFKHGELKAAGGRTVRSRRQAVAIALRESGSSNQESAAENRAALRTTKARERAGRTGRAEAESGPDATKAGLYARARKAGIEGRSTMTKEQLRRALGEEGVRGRSGGGFSFPPSFRTPRSGDPEPTTGHGTRS